MPKIRMKDTTAHADYGQMLQGEVYDVSDEHEAHLIRQGIARKAHSDTQTYHERMALAESEEGGESPTNPSIERQVEEAGTKPGDQSGPEFGTGGRAPLNAPPNAPPNAPQDQPARGNPPGRQQPQQPGNRGR